MHSRSFLMKRIQIYLLRHRKIWQLQLIPTRLHLCNPWQRNIFPVVYAKHRNNFLLFCRRPLKPVCKGTNIIKKRCDQIQNLIAALFYGPAAPLYIIRKRNTYKHIPELLLSLNRQCRRPRQDYGRLYSPFESFWLPLLFLDRKRHRHIELANSRQRCKAGFLPYEQ